MRDGFAAIVVFGLFACAGCGDRASSTTMPATPGSAAAKRDTPVVDLKVVKYDQLAEALKSNHGKIVVMDLWGMGCIPCKKEFHHLVEMHNKYESQGVACVSLNLDEPKDKDDALQFLRNKQAYFANYVLDETIDFCQDKWNFTGIPVVVVYNRRGDIARTFTNDDPDNQFTYEDVEKLVKQLLATVPARPRDD